MKQLGRVKNKTHLKGSKRTNGKFDILAQHVNSNLLYNSGERSLRNRKRRLVLVETNFLERSDAWPETSFDFSMFVLIVDLVLVVRVRVVFCHDVAETFWFSRLLLVVAGFLSV